MQTDSVNLTYPQGFRTDPYILQFYKDIQKRRLQSHERKSPERCLFQGFSSLDYQDSNLDKQNQNLLCYHYTIVQTYVLSVKKRCKDRGLQANLQIFRSLFYVLSSESCIITLQSANNSSFYRAEQADISHRASQQL